MDLHPLATFHRQARPQEAGNGSTGEKSGNDPPRKRPTQRDKGVTAPLRNKLFDHDRPDADGIDPDDDDDDMSAMSLSPGMGWPSSRFL